MFRMIDHFRGEDIRLAEQDRQRRSWFIAAKEHRKQKELVEDKAEETFIAVASAVIVATEIEIKAFQQKLDQYDTLTVQALMDNQEALAVVEHQIEAMLNRAHRMEDGRRVFKSEDGTWAVDQDGQRLDPDIDDIPSIPETRDTAEAYLEQLERKQALMQERKKLVEFQEKLDKAREHSSQGGFTKDELDELEADIEMSMPQLLRNKIAGNDKFENARHAKSEFSATTSSTPLSLNQTLKATGQKNSM